MVAKQRSTLVLVAERAGVSIASVSRVLNDLPASADVAERVRQAARELGYVPDATARSLKAGRTEQIAIAVADVGNPVYVQMMRTVAAELGETPYRLVLSSTGDDPEAQIELLSSLNRGFADGLILIPIRLTDRLVNAIGASRLPIVVIGSIPDGLDVDNVRADSATGIALALEHLAAAGHRRIGFLNGPRDTVPGEARRRGFDLAMARLGLEASAVVEASDFTFPAGTVVAPQLLADPTHRPDAVVCANDLLAIAAIKAITDAGLRVPEDVAVIGTDDSDVALLANPALTSVDLGARERSRIAAQLLLERLADPARATQRVVVPPTLTIRESTR
jgi:LacI family transcriptional regulator